MTHLPASFWWLWFAAVEVMAFVFILSACQLAARADEAMERWHAAVVKRGAGR